MNDCCILSGWQGLCAHLVRIRTVLRWVWRRLPRLQLMKCTVVALLLIPVSWALAADEPPLHKAARDGTPAEIHALIAAGEDPNAADKYGVHPLYRAAVNGRDANVRALLAGGADPNAHRLPVSIAERATRLLKGTFLGVTPIQSAASYGTPATIRMLLDAGADPNVRDENGYTPLLSVDYDNSEWAGWRILGNYYYDGLANVRALLAGGADPNACNENGDTPLHKAVYYGNAEAIRILLNAGANPNTISKYGGTPLDVAVRRYGDGIHAKILREAGARKSVWRKRRRWCRP